MDKVTLEKLSKRPNFLKDHNLKYLEFKALSQNRVGKLREIIESLPEGKQRALGREIVEWINTGFTEILKDYDGLQEGSHLRNALEDVTASLIFKEKEVELLTQIVNDLRRRSPKKNI